MTHHKTSPQGKKEKVRPRNSRHRNKGADMAKAGSSRKNRKCKPKTVSDGKESLMERNGLRHRTGGFI